jgi:hypothetical protein
MKAIWNGGLTIRLIRSNKVKGNSQSKLECTESGFKRPKLTIHIVEEVSEREIEGEPGVHIETYPPIPGPENKEGYIIYLSKIRFTEITNINDSTKEGYFVRRSKYDRIDITY